MKINAQFKNKNRILKRKNNVEIISVNEKINKSKYDLIIPSAMFIFILVSLLYLSEIEKSVDYSILACILIAFFSSLITFIIQILYGRSFLKSPRFKICNKCFNKDSLGLKKCFCGGEYEPPDYFDCIETENNNKK